MKLRLALWIGRLGPCGLAPKGPGTAGSLATLIVFYAIGPQALWVHALVVAALMAVGSWACHVVTSTLGSEDPGDLCIDEAVGQWMVAAAAPFSWPWLLIAFGLFRFFDIAKPFPVRWLDDHIKGGIGVMVDDVGAGVYGILVLILLQRWSWFSDWVSTFSG